MGESMAKWHQKKEISDAIEYALDRGWRLEKAGGHAHVWGTLSCPAGTREGCKTPVPSTPRVPAHIAEKIRKAVDRCHHQAPISAADGAEP